MKNNELSKELKELYNCKQGACYINADKLFKDEICKYVVIGYAQHKESKHAIRHAWNMTEKEEIVDVTVEVDINEVTYYPIFKFDLKSFYKEGVIFKCSGNDYNKYDLKAELKCIEENNLNIYATEKFKYLMEGIEIDGTARIKNNNGKIEICDFNIDDEDVTPVLEGEMPF